MTGFLPPVPALQARVPSGRARPAAPRRQPQLDQQLESTQTTAEVAIVSIGTNDAAPWKQVAPEIFRGALPAFVPRVPAARLVYLGSPGVDENRLSGEHDRTNVFDHDGVHLNKFGYDHLLAALAEVVAAR